MTLSGAPPYCSDHPSYHLIVHAELGTMAIKFLPCGTISHNPNDITNRYCARCHRFIEDMTSRE